MENSQDAVATALNYITTRGSDLAIAIVAAIIIFVVGKMFAKWSAKTVGRLARNRLDDEALAGFLSKLVYALVLTFVVIAAVSKLGVQTTSFIAVLGAAGLAVGMALQGSLANFASGVLLLIFRPISVGEYVEVAGESGTVEEISIFTTTLITPDNKVVIIANAGVTGSNITNYSRKDTRRVDITFGIAYDADIRKAKDILLEEIKACDKILSDPEPFIGVVNLGASSVDIVTRSWVNTADYWAVYFHLMESVKYRFDAEGIGIPFPQTDVHLYRADA